MSQPRIHTNNKDLKKIIKSAEKQGWHVKLSSKHIKWLAPDGKTLLYSPRTATTRSWNNFMAMLKKAGWNER